MDNIKEELKNFAYELKNSGYREAALSFLDKINELFENSEQNVTAKEMFEKLGYELVKEKDGIITYDKHGKYEFKVIDFRLKEIMINENDEYCPRLTPDEVKAIYKQIEELGWFDEN